MHTCTIRGCVACRSWPGLRRNALAAIFAAGLLSLTVTPSLAMPRAERVVSPGGIEAWLLETRQVPLITIAFSFKGGALQEPSDKLGVAYLTTFLFNEGAGGMDTQALTRKRQRIAVQFSCGTYMMENKCTFSTPSAHGGEAFDLLRLAIAEPRFDAEPLEQARRQLLTELEYETQDPGSLAWYALARQLYGQNRYSLPVKGTPDGARSVTRDDVAAYRSRTFARDNLRISVAGDIDAATLGPLLDKVFGDLPAKSTAMALPVVSTESAQPTRQSIAMDLPQATALFGNIVPKMEWRKAIAFSIANQILSGTFTGRLFKEVREKQGLVYTIASAHGEFEKFGTFYGSFGAVSENAAKAMTFTIAELERLRSEGPTEDELRDAKQSYLGGIYLGMDTSDKLASWFLTLQTQDLPITYLDDFIAEVEHLDVEAVKAAAREVIRPDRLAQVFVGPVKLDAQDAPQPASSP